MKRAGTRVEVHAAIRVRFGDVFKSAPSMELVDVVTSMPGVDDILYVYNIWESNGMVKLTPKPTFTKAWDYTNRVRKLKEFDIPFKTIRRTITWTAETVFDEDDHLCETIASFAENKQFNGLKTISGSTYKKISAYPKRFTHLVVTSGIVDAATRKQFKENYLKVGRTHMFICDGEIATMLRLRFTTAMIAKFR